MAAFGNVVEIIPCDGDSISDTHISELLEFFKNKFGKSAEFVVQSPGRVNLIGDHIDYHGFAVLPMAIERCILLACSTVPGSSKLCLSNADDRQFGDWQGPTGLGHGPCLAKSSNWYNYFLCGYHGIVDTFVQDTEKARSLGLNVAVTSNLPVASGVSSSSALVCGSALGVIQGYIESVPDMLNIDNMIEHEMVAPRAPGEFGVNKQSLATLCPVYERLIGTHSGGMDQAVIMTAEKGFAKYVEFMPLLACRNVQLPENISYLISHSGVRYPKAATSGYNARVLETRLGAALAAKVGKLIHRKLDSCITWYEVQHQLEMSSDDLIEYLKLEVFKSRDIFTVEEICKELELTREQLIENFSTTDEFLSIQMNDQLKLGPRAYHVIAEAERVEKFRSICESNQVDVEALGKLMIDSHNSLRDLYECSHETLDTIVSTALKAGALGCRLTGAGWGGCAVSMVHDNDVTKVCEALRHVSSFTIKTEPQSGCKIYRLQ